MGRTLFEKLITIQLLKKFPALYGIQKFITCSKDPATGPCPEPYESSAYSHTLFLKDLLNPQLFQTC